MNNLASNYPTEHGNKSVCQNCFTEVLGKASVCPNCDEPMLTADKDKTKDSVNTKHQDEDCDEVYTNEALEEYRDVDSLNDSIWSVCANKSCNFIGHTNDLTCPECGCETTPAV